jgi:hypothetical protein
MIKYIKYKHDNTDQNILKQYEALNQPQSAHLWRFG